MLPAARKKAFQPGSSAAAAAGALANAPSDPQPPPPAAAAATWDDLEADLALFLGSGGEETGSEGEEQGGEGLGLDAEMAMTMVFLGALPSTITGTENQLQKAKDNLTNKQATLAAVIKKKGKKNRDGTYPGQKAAENEVEQAKQSVDALTAHLDKLKKTPPPSGGGGTGPGPGVAGPIDPGPHRWSPEATDFAANLRLIATTTPDALKAASLLPPAKWADRVTTDYRLPIFMLDALHQLALRDPGHVILPNVDEVNHTMQYAYHRTPIQERIEEHIAPPPVIPGGYMRDRRAFHQGVWAVLHHDTTHEAGMAKRAQTLIDYLRADKLQFPVNDWKILTGARTPAAADISAAIDALRAHFNDAASPTERAYAQVLKAIPGAAATTAKAADIQSSDTGTLIGVGVAMQQHIGALSADETLKEPLLRVCMYLHAVWEAVKAHNASKAVPPYRDYPPYADTATDEAAQATLYDPLDTLNPAIDPGIRQRIEDTSFHPGAWQRLHTWRADMNALGTDLKVDGTIRSADFSTIPTPLSDPDPMRTLSIDATALAAAMKRARDYNGVVEPTSITKHITDLDPTVINNTAVRLMEVGRWGESRALATKAGIRAAQLRPAAAGAPDAAADAVMLSKDLYAPLRKAFYVVAAAQARVLVKRVLDSVIPAHGPALAIATLLAFERSLDLRGIPEYRAALAEYVFHMMSAEWGGDTRQGWFRAAYEAIADHLNKTDNMPDGGEFTAAFNKHAGSTKEFWDTPVLKETFRALLALDAKGLEYSHNTGFSSALGAVAGEYAVRTLQTNRKAPALEGHNAEAATTALALAYLLPTVDDLTDKTRPDIVDPFIDGALRACGAAAFHSGHSPDEVHRVIELGYIPACREALIKRTTDKEDEDAMNAVAAAVTKANTDTWGAMPQFDIGLYAAMYTAVRMRATGKGIILGRYTAFLLGATAFLAAHPGTFDVPALDAAGEEEETEWMLEKNIVTNTSTTTTTTTTGDGTSTTTTTAAPPANTAEVIRDWDAAVAAVETLLATQPTADATSARTQETATWVAALRKHWTTVHEGVATLARVTADAAGSPEANDATAFEAAVPPKIAELKPKVEAAANALLPAAEAAAAETLAGVRDKTTKAEPWFRSVADCRQQITTMAKTGSTAVAPIIPTIGKPSEFQKAAAALKAMNTGLPPQKDRDNYPLLYPDGKVITDLEAQAESTEKCALPIVQLCRELLENPITDWPAEPVHKTNAETRELVRKAKEGGQKMKDDWQAVLDIRAEAEQARADAIAAAEKRFADYLKNQTAKQWTDALADIDAAGTRVDTLIAGARTTTPLLKDLTPANIAAIADAYTAGVLAGAKKALTASTQADNEKTAVENVYLPEIEDATARQARKDDLVKAKADLYTLRGKPCLDRAEAVKRTARAWVVGVIDEAAKRVDAIETDTAKAATDLQAVMTGTVQPILDVILNKSEDAAGPAPAAVKQATVDTASTDAARGNAGVVRAKQEATHLRALLTAAAAALLAIEEAAAPAGLGGTAAAAHKQATDATAKVDGEITTKATDAAKVVAQINAAAMEADAWVKRLRTAAGVVGPPPPPVAGPGGAGAAATPLTLPAITKAATDFVAAVHKFKAEARWMDGEIGKAAAGVRKMQADLANCQPAVAEAEVPALQAIFRSILTEQATRITAGPPVTELNAIIAAIQAADPTTDTPEATATRGEIVKAITDTIALFASEVDARNAMADSVEKDFRIAEGTAQFAIANGVEFLKGPAVHRTVTLVETDQWNKNKAKKAELKAEKAAHKVTADKLAAELARYNTDMLALEGRRKALEDEKGLLAIDLANSKRDVATLQGTLAGLPATATALAAANSDVLRLQAELNTAKTLLATAGGGGGGGAAVVALTRERDTARGALAAEQRAHAAEQRRGVALLTWGEAQRGWARECYPYYRKHVEFYGRIWEPQGGPEKLPAELTAPAP
jgi:hypothetical protein